MNGALSGTKNTVNTLNVAVNHVLIDDWYLVPFEMKNAVGQFNLKLYRVLKDMSNVLCTCKLKITQEMINDANSDG